MLFRLSAAAFVQEIIGKYQPPKPDRLLELIAAVSKVGDRYPLGTMLKGALVAMKQDDFINPELFAHAALSLRELMDRFERMKVSEHADQATIEDAGNNETKRREYADKWLQLKSSSVCFNQATASWAGAIDLHLLNFLNETETFIRRYKARDIYLKTKQTKVMLILDPMFENLSEDEQQRVALEWSRLKEFFNGIAHHSKTTRPEMESALVRLEIFLHRRLIPVEVANKNAILAFIEGIENS